VRLHRAAIVAACTVLAATFACAKENAVRPIVIESPPPPPDAKPPEHAKEEIVDAASRNLTAPAGMTMILDSAVLRALPRGLAFGPVIAALPVWRELLRGRLDPVRDADLVWVRGPSLVHTEHAMIVVRANVTEGVLDGAVTAASKGYARGGAFDAGIAGTPAFRAYAEGAERVIVRPPGKWMTIAAPADIDAAAHAHERAAVVNGDVYHVTLDDPTKLIRLPGLAWNADVTRVDFGVRARADGGADMTVVGACVDEAAAEAATAAANDAITTTWNTMGVRLITRNILANVAAVQEGSGFRVAIPASADQVQAILALLQAMLGLPSGGGP